MTKDEALDLALEALKKLYGVLTIEEIEPVDKAIAAIKQARALDKKAENARELGLDYEPADGTQVSKVWWDGEKLMAKPIPFVEFYKPVQDELAYREAVSLATWLFKKHFAREEHYASGRVVWEPCDTTAGVISQIDNMVCGLVQPAATVKESLTVQPAAPVQEPSGLTNRYTAAQPAYKDSTPQLYIGNIKPNYNISFHNNGQEIGKLDFNGPALVFTGDAEESAKVFIDWVARSFAGRLKEERQAERDRLAKECALLPFGDTAASFAVWIKNGGKP